jgi:hypothetical protein
VLSANGGESGNPVVSSVDASSASVCEILADSQTVKRLAVGVCTIDANQDGDDAYSQAPQVQQSFATGFFVTTVSLPEATVGTAYVEHLATDGGKAPKHGKPLLRYRTV